jgi:ClpP class serine protease
MSRGTLIAIAADEIRMDPYAVFGPIDPQILDPKAGSVPAASVVKTVQTKGPEKVDDKTLIKADITEKAIRQLEELVVELTGDHGEEKKLKSLQKSLFTASGP